MNYKSNSSLFSLRLLIVLYAILFVELAHNAAVAQTPTSVRFATFNCSLSRDGAGELVTELANESAQANQIAQVVQTVRPDVLLLNEFDYDSDQIAIKQFLTNYLGVSQNGGTPIEYPFFYSGPVNTGVDSGLDLNNDARKGTPDDAYGFGKHPGHYGMVVLSRFPIDNQAVRTFQKFKWSDMPRAQAPILPDSGKPYFGDNVWKELRLSSKSHWDVPIQINEMTIHFLVGHPTPPVFDGDEDRNGCRNHDEIRFWADYVSDTGNDYIYDDSGTVGGIPIDSLFVIAGDMNADPNDGDNREHAIRQLLQHPRIQDIAPTSEGAVEAGKTQAEKNLTHSGDAANDTGDFNDRAVGNLRIDYVLPSNELVVGKCGVFWPKADDDAFGLNSASDHHCVWIDIQVESKK
ncbi:MAG: endonuclease/exonuclease/phosphatase family protein [Pirellulaceae bacterium]